MPLMTINAKESQNMSIHYFISHGLNQLFNKFIKLSNNRLKNKIEIIETFVLLLIVLLIVSSSRRQIVRYFCDRFVVLLLIWLNCVNCLLFKVLKAKETQKDVNIESLQIHSQPIHRSIIGHWVSINIFVKLM
jgi:hypothetical protein